MTEIGNYQVKRSEELRRILDNLLLEREKLLNSMEADALLLCKSSDSITKHIGQAWMDIINYERKEF